MSSHHVPEMLPFPTFCYKPSMWCATLQTSYRLKHCMLKCPPGKNEKKTKEEKKISLWTKSAHMLCSVDTPSPPQRKVASLSL